MNADAAQMNVPQQRFFWATFICGVFSAFICVNALAAARVEVAFSPGDDIPTLIAERIGHAKKTVHMQAYLFTDRGIANALLGARKRGVAVEVIGDAHQHANGGLPHLKALDRAGVRVWLDAAHSAAHDKVIIVDAALPGAVVITGSYNFTRAAHQSNAENVVFISGSRAVTERFLANFEKHRRESTPWR
jgi:phosphatidylserine/phosphatidylglycerophosphate/cardiolipin synthase-like enzyme